MSDEQTPLDGDPQLTAEDEAAIAAEVSSELGGEATPEEKIKHALIAAKRQNRVLNRRVKELEPVAARATEVDQKLTDAMPVITALQKNPRLMAEAMRLADAGTRTSSERTDQPNENDDPEASEFAEIQGYYLTDGMTPDIARGRRALQLLDKRHGRQTAEQMRPLAGAVVGNQAERNIAHAASLTDEDGTPLATQESIDETVKMMGGRGSGLLASPAIIDILINNAIGLDRRKGRTPKPVEEPLYLAPQGGGRGVREPGITPEEKRIAERLGLTVEEYTKSAKKLESSAGSRRGMVMGSKH